MRFDARGYEYDDNIFLFQRLVFFKRIRLSYNSSSTRNIIYKSQAV